MKINLDSPSEEVQIQIIPLIDVIFCILTFFILAALQLTRPQSINVDLPTARSGVAQMQENLVVTISPSGQIYVNKDPININQLYVVLQEYQRNNPNGLLVLNASQTALYSDVVQVLDLMRLVGGDRVALATQTPTDNANPSPSLTNPTPGTIDPLNPSGTPNPGGSLNPGQFQFPPSSGQSPNPSTPETVPNLFPGLPGGTGTPTQPAPSPNP